MKSYQTVYLLSASVLIGLAVSLMVAVPLVGVAVPLLVGTLIGAAVWLITSIIVDAINDRGRP